MSTPKALYLAGPMTGRPQFNFPLFIEAAELLRDRGFNIISPAELDSEEVKEAALASPDGKLDENDRIAGESWGEILARDVRTVADDCDGIVLLPEWNTSRGARLETFVALLCGHDVFIYDEGSLIPADMDKVKMGVLS